MTSLSWPQVNAWRLANHSLIERAPRSDLHKVVTTILGIHAQMMSAAELQVWARLRDVNSGDTQDALWTERKLVKTWAMRGTLHLLPPDDYGLYMAALRTRENWRSAPWLKYFDMTIAEMEALIEGVRQALDGRCLTREELANEVALITGTARFREQLLSGWGSFLKPAASLGYLCFGPSQGQAVTFVRPDQWIGPWKEWDSKLALQELLRRYLIAYGPATIEDFARWLGVAPAPREVRPIFQALASELEEVTIDNWKGYALTTTVTQIQSMAEVSTVRLLPNFDLYINLNYPHRRFMLDPAYTDRVYRKSAWVSPVVLVDGRMAGVWSYEKKRTRTLVGVEMFVPSKGSVEEAIEEEARKLGSFIGAPAEVAYAE
jgi:hypothetical protein